MRPVILRPLSEYLASSPVIDWHHSSIRATAARITAAHPEELSRARALYEWVRDAVPHSADASRDDLPCAASEVLTAGTGLCYAKAHLLAALLRAVRIPAGFCYQVCPDPTPENPQRSILHGLNGMYLRSRDRWLRVDPRGNAPGLNAQFSAAEERLAYPELPFLDASIHPEPLPHVVRALRAYPTLTDLWPHLPGPLDPGTD